MLRISDNKQWLEIAENITHQQVLSAEKIGYKYKDIARLLKQD